MKRQRGFTLIEIAIVLVIIGLLLGGILKGQEMITQGKIKNAIADFNGVQAAYFGYQDRYRALPGDDPGATRWSGATAGNGNGLIAGLYNSTTAGDESRLFWQHLRFSAFVSGSGQQQPSNAFNGLIGVQTGDGAATPAQALGFFGVIICSTAVPDKVAIAIDSNMDDGILSSGQVRSQLQTGLTSPALTASAATTNYQDTGANLYAVCKTT